uniref:mitogen-activated protein kinase kinase kinase 18-like n=1 Tax=Erigeron canadensis TaxID=72917 RepID=UPI001CB95AB2|nr:mitogen-activated protein kinase kinase kinase 18-like [Erigeron canadensis]
MNWKRGPIIGRGSSATVSVATTSTNDVFAVKSTDLATSKFLQKEQHFLSKIAHKHVIKYMGFDVTYENNKQMYNLFMEYAKSGTIFDMIKKNGGSLDIYLIKSYIYQILLGLEYLHDNNIVHCDIKSMNLLVCEEGIKIGDFGCAKVIENGGVSSSVFSGTPVFMAPEVARGEKQETLADVWATGCVIIEMATGFNPWPEINDPVACLYKIGYSGELPEIPKWFPEDGKDFLEKCLKLDVQERWSVKQLLEHPFVCNLNSGFEIRNSPTSILDQGFWESLSVPETSPEMSQIGGIVRVSPVERLRQLVENGCSSLPNWDDNEDWIAVRSNEIEQMDVELGSDFGNVDVELISFSNSIVDYEEVELNSVVRDEDYDVVDNLFVIRVLDFEHIINDIFLQMKDGWTPGLLSKKSQVRYSRPVIARQEFVMAFVELLPGGAGGRGGGDREKQKTHYNQIKRSEKKGRRERLVPCDMWGKKSCPSKKM